MSFLQRACMLYIYSFACICRENYEMVHKLVKVIASGEGTQED